MADNRENFVTVVTHYRSIAHLVEGVIIVLAALPYLFASSEYSAMPYTRIIKPLIFLHLIAELVQGSLLLAGVIKVNKRINCVYLVVNAIATSIKHIALLLVLIRGVHLVLKYYILIYYAFDWSTYACTVLYYRNLCKRERRWRRRDHERQDLPTLV